MHFTRLRLSGFKSFVDPVDLDILPGMTGVVGPNGCGKSNLLEALRWAMGETSYKSMRGSGMEDVIFAGTTGRPSRNHAEVSLYLDNSDRTAPAEYNGAEGLEIVRRIERDAGSAYRINGRDVRAKDVQLLFADASTGARSTALVRQGQIGELINAKPEARRRVLEEAAGISGLHSRRHEAELRLRAAEGNLEKVDEAIGQLESELRALRRQARQATRYRALSGQIRQAEALALHLRWKNCLEQLEDLSQALTEARQTVNEKTSQATQTSAHQTHVQASLPPLREAEAAAAAAVRRLTLERESLDAEEQRARDLIARLTRQRDELLADQKRESTALEEATAEMARLKAEHAELQAAVASDEQAAEAAAKEAMADAAERLRQAEAAFDEANRLAAETHARRQSLERALQSLRDRHQKIEENRLLREQSRQDIQAEVLSPHENARLEAERLTAEQAVAEAVNAREAASRIMHDRESALEALQVPLREAQSLVERLVGEQAALSALFARPEGGKTYPSLVDALRVESGFEVALGAALGDDLDASVDLEAPAHWRDLPDMVNPPALPNGVKALGQFVSGARALSRRLSQIGIVDTAEAGHALQDQLALGQRLVSRNGDLWRWDGYCVMAESETAAAKRLAQRQRLREIGSEISEAEVQLAQREQANEEARQNYRQSVEDERQAASQLEECRARLVQAREALAEAMRVTSDRETRLKALDEALAALAQDAADVSAQVVGAEAELSELAALPDAQNDITRLRTEVDDWRSKMAAARATFEQLRSQRQLREERLARIAAESELWDKRHQGAEAQIQSLEQRHQAVSDELEKANKIPPDLAERRNVLVTLIQEAEGKRKIEADRLALAETQLAEADKAAREAQAALVTSRETLVRLEANRDNLVEREGEAAQRIREVLQIEPEKALEASEHDPNKAFPDVAHVEAQLEKLRRERETLGGVNLRADEEATEIEQRIAAMSSERDDLAQAINKLRYGVGQLNREGRERLKAAFESVNHHFGRLFTQLFGGGKAHLELTESDDPLEAGLEIIAHPPGKKPQVMSLLSGGEQALTAMALIFAVFLTNPSPICVLDEVDAPLDDANVERYCNMIREIAEETGTRFLLITHHALTMARVDRLYGVTMQEQGVSSLMSVDLKQAEQFAELDDPDDDRTPIQQISS